jgi:hypothetical protein
MLRRARQFVRAIAFVRAGELAATIGVQTTEDARNPHNPASAALGPAKAILQVSAPQSFPRIRSIPVWRCVRWLTIY